MQYHIWAKPDCTVVLGHLEKKIAAALAPMMDKNVAGLISAGSRARAMKLYHLWFIRRHVYYIIPGVHVISLRARVRVRPFLPITSLPQCSVTL